MAAPPRIHFVRHGQAFHNLSADLYHLPDPLLTPLGKRQCEELRNTFPHHASISIIISSPLTRCLQTSVLAFPATISLHPRPIVAQPLLQETSHLPCDTGTAFPLLLGGLPNLLGISAARVDLSHLTDHEWLDKRANGPHGTSGKSLEARAKSARQWLRMLRNKGHTDVAVVCHAGFLGWLTGTRRASWAVQKGKDQWENCEWRTYEFVSGDDKDAVLVEAAESRVRRGVCSEEEAAHEETEKSAARKSWKDLLKPKKGERDEDGGEGYGGEMESLNKAQHTTLMKNRDWVGGY
ncbi:phosphoglycerate mutase-like protein [Eremomyces bilateralis CBS 781.70]|uniref:Phosphoglycerate mutase-like protein n=1 Tax=Eremomyces bilateralis CBS 781.70 TaxID=1392243 RepID=A0A6G1FU42_9PEZI|nr:phosphoglycerate mutase-like protein [Eremomyces bilateralis CBS 781.70]KAF1809317.1 phosphoglycerate mutase-like protein [Eremomyces bilateralis CBS 781.70]